MSSKIIDNIPSNNNVNGSNMTPFNHHKANKDKKGLILEPNELDSYIDNLENNVLINKIKYNSNGYDFDVKGAFEFHITVRIKNKDDIDLFVNYCKEIGVKPIFIELPYGQEIKQLMTSKYITGEYPNVLKPVYSTAYKLRNKGFEILRVKIESLACNKGVPLNSYGNDLKYEPSGRYFEFHFKIKLKDLNEKERLRMIGQKYNAHTSRNAFKKFDNGSFTNFLTMRAFNKGSNDAIKQFNKLKCELFKEGFDILGTEKEYVVYDSNLDLDKGWVKKEKKTKYGLSFNINNNSIYNVASLLIVASSFYYLFT